MAAFPKKIKLMVEYHGVNDKYDQVEIKLKHKKKKLQIQDGEEKKEQFNMEVNIIDQEASEHEMMDQGELDVSEALGHNAGKKTEKPGTSAVLMDSNINKPKMTDKKRRLALLPWKPFSLANILKLPEEKIPIEKGLGSTGGEHNVDTDKKNP